MVHDIKYHFNLLCISRFFIECVILTYYYDDEIQRTKQETI